MTNVINNKTRKKMRMISFQDSGESEGEVQDDITTTMHLFTCTVLVNKTAHPGL